MTRAPLVILILDEDDEMRSLMAGQIRSAEYQLLLAGDSAQALKLLAASGVSLLLINSKIPEISVPDFMEKVRAIRSAKELAVLALMNPNKAHEESGFLQAGVADFLVRPFDRTELNMKIRNLLKTIHPTLDQGQEKAGRLSFKDLVLDIHSYDVFSKGERVKLTPNEFKLLQALLEHPGEILSRDRLIDLVQGEGVAVIDRAVDTHIFSLRKKLGVVGEMINTIRGEGYRIG